MKETTKQYCEFLRHQAKRRFDKVRHTWCDLLRWGLPHKSSWILSQTQGERKNQHIVDPTHILAQRSYVAGFLEGNTSASRPWYRAGVKDGDVMEDFEAKEWLQHFTQRTLTNLGTSNFYHSAGNFYYDYSTVNTGAHYIETLKNGFHFHTLIPGSYFVLDNAYGEAEILIREFALNVKSIVDKYGKFNSSGLRDWSNISKHVRKSYEDGDYSRMMDLVHLVLPNPDFEVDRPERPDNRKWLELTYELGTAGAHGSSEAQEFVQSPDIGKDIFLKRYTGKRKPFIVGKSTDDFEYGEKGPTLDALGLIKSLNKKALSKDQALEQMLSPTLQGPASLRKSYISTAANTFIPIDGRSASRNQKLESVFQISPAIGAVIQDVGDLRQIVDKIYYADFLLFLSKNPKTRTATEANAIVEEQQRIIGPNLQSLNRTYNVPVVEWVMDWTLFEDPYLKPVPKILEGKTLRPEFVSVFAQAQKAADLPAIDRYLGMIANVAQIDPKILDKANLDKLADLYEDRLYLPSGLNNPQDKVDAQREQSMREAKRQQALEQTIPAVAKAAKDASQIQQPNQQEV